MLNGSLEQDKLFAPGDKAMVVVSYQGDEILSVTMTDHYRIGKEALLAAVFAVFLILFAGRTGVRAIVSFVLTVLMLWKVLVPLYLKGWTPIPVSYTHLSFTISYKEFSLFYTTLIAHSPIYPLSWQRTERIKITLEESELSLIHI